MLGTIKSKKGKLWMLLREAKSQQNAPLAEALKGGLEPLWLLWLGLSHRLFERERNNMWHPNDVSRYKLIAKRIVHVF